MQQDNKAESTKHAKRMVSKGSEISGIFGFDKRSVQKLPLFIARIAAGFPSPADDFIEDRLDLNEFLIKHPAATFFVRVAGDSMLKAGIHSGDILIVDRALSATNNKIIIAVLNGELTVKRMQQRQHETYLVPENDAFQPIKITEAMDFEIWGVVTYVIHPV